MQTQMQTTKRGTTKPTVESTSTPVIVPQTPTIKETTETLPISLPPATLPATTMVTQTEQRQIEARVATQTAPTPPHPRDLVGADVFYILPHTTQRRPGTVTFDYETEGGLVDITVLTRGKLDGYPEGTQGYNGVIPVSDVTYAPATDKQPGTWHWRTERA